MCAVAWKASILAVQKAGKVHDATPVFLLRDTINDFILFIFYDLYLTVLDRIPAIRYLYWEKKTYQHLWDNFTVLFSYTGIKTACCWEYPVKMCKGYIFCSAVASPWNSSNSSRFFKIKLKYFYRNLINYYHKLTNLLELVVHSN